MDTATKQQYQKDGENSPKEQNGIMNNFGNCAGNRDYRMDGGIPDEVVMSEAYQRELKKLQEHYGYRATLDSYYQAEWDKEGAFARKRPEYDLWQRVEAEKDIIAADFATSIHPMLAEGKTAEEIIAKLGSFEDYLKETLESTIYQLLLNDAKVLSVLKRTKRKWWFEY